MTDGTNKRVEVDYVNTSSISEENLNLGNEIKRFRTDTRAYFEKTFENLEDVKLRYLIDFPGYIKTHPGSAILLSTQDLHLWPVLVDEAKGFAQNHKGSTRWLAYDEEHESEHLAEAWRVGIDVTGVGLVLYKRFGKPNFVGFVFHHDENATRADRIRLSLAPTLPSEGDMIISLNLLFQSETMEEFLANYYEIFASFSEKTPKKFVKFVGKVIKG